MQRQALAHELPSWPAGYAGIPFADRGRTRAGCDCWGLARLIWRDRCDLRLPEGAGYATAHDPDAVAGVIQGGLAPDWLTVPAGEERPYDGVLLAGLSQVGGGPVRRTPMHVGVVIVPGWLIHMQDGVGVAVEDYRNGRRLRHRVLGFYRHCELAGYRHE